MRSVVAIISAVLVLMSFPAVLAGCSTLGACVSVGGPYEHHEQSVAQGVVRHDYWYTATADVTGLGWTTGLIEIKEGGGVVGAGSCGDYNSCGAKAETVKLAHPRCVFAVGSTESLAGTWSEVKGPRGTACSPTRIADNYPSADCVQALDSLLEVAECLPDATRTLP